MHNYQLKLLEMIADGRRISTAESSTADVLHDDDCGVFRAPPRECDCDPEIVVRRGINPPLGSGAQN